MIIGWANKGKAIREEERTVIDTYMKGINELKKG
jgi:hypothetical protein